MPNDLFLQKSFICPHCKISSQQFWSKACDLKVTKAEMQEYGEQCADIMHHHENALFKNRYTIPDPPEPLELCHIEKSINLAICNTCGGASIWIDSEMIFPERNNAPQPNDDMPELVKELYLEAASVMQKSPRAAAALLRLALEALCDYLKAKGSNLNEKISFIISQNSIDTETKKVLDIIRYIGNEAVHNPGEIILDDNKPENVEFYTTLFTFINMAVEGLITRGKNTDAVFNALPQSIKDQIAKRDKK